MQPFWRFTATFFLLTLSLLLPGCDKRVADVKASFNRFADALVERNGKVAAAHTCQSNFEYYARIRDLALTATKDELLSRSITERVEALFARQKIDPKVLKTLDGKAVFVAIIENGLYGFDEPMRLKSVKLGKTTATGTVIVPRDTTSFSYVFAFEDDEWKVDFQSPDKKLDREARSAARDARMSETELTEVNFEWMAQEDFPPELWKPPSK